MRDSTETGRTMWYSMSPMFSMEKSTPMDVRWPKGSQPR